MGIRIIYVYPTMFEKSYHFLIYFLKIFHLDFRYWNFSEVSFFFPVLHGRFGAFVVVAASAFGYTG